MAKESRLLEQLSLQQLKDKKDVFGKDFEIVKSMGSFLINFEEHYTKPFKERQDIIREFIDKLYENKTLEKSDINAYYTGDPVCIQDGNVIAYHPIQFLQIKKIEDKEGK
jgi:hypothetical protein